MLLSVPSTESFISIRRQLLDALKARGITEINGNRVPEDPAELEFAVPTDPAKLGQGWLPLDVPTETTRRGVLNATPVAAGLKDSSVVAFKFRKSVEGLSAEEQIQLDLDDSGWDVLIPTLDDDDFE